MPNPTAGSFDPEAIRFAGPFLVAIIAGFLTFFLGRWSKNLELLKTDLSERAKEYRDLLAQIEKNAVGYWTQSQNDSTESLGADLPVSLHRLQCYRVYCSDVCKDFKSEYIRTLEDQLWEAITGADFQGAGRPADQARATRVRHTVTSLTIASLHARRSALFLFRAKS